MRFKLLSVFLAIQLVSFGIWNTFFNESTQAATESELKLNPLPEALELSSAALIEAGDVEELELSEVVELSDAEVITAKTKAKKEAVVLPTFPHFSARNQAGENEELLQPIHENQIEQAFLQLPKAHIETVKNITLDYSPEAHRGLGGGSLIILRAVNMSSEEFVGVLIHELGHNVDYGFLVPSKEEVASEFMDGGTVLFESDPSVDFYRLSWQSNTQHKPGVSELDFVSGYAMSDPFEDFAETYIYYILHQKDFEVLTKRSEVLQAKYNFMRDVVFEGENFNLGDGEVDPNQNIWDTTVLPYDLDGFMGKKS